MSGSSLDGLDIAYVEFSIADDNINQISFKLLHHSCLPFENTWLEKLKMATSFNIPQFLELHTAFGRYVGLAVNEFIASNNIKEKIDLIASHGHTIHHNPSNFTSFQLGDGAQIAAITGIPVVADLRNTDVALGGQGAPIVPIADKLLFNDHAYCLNIGGIANITINNQHPIAFDICPANQLLNHFANQKGYDFDDGGNMARSGNIDHTLLALLLSDDFIQAPHPKSLDNTYSKQVVLPQLIHLSPEDALATSVAYIATNIANALIPFTNKANSSLLITGGGAHNNYLTEIIKSKLAAKNITTCIPDTSIINNKEAIAMALIGLLRILDIPNVLHSVTGASKNSIGGSFWKA